MGSAIGCGTSRSVLVAKAVVKNGVANLSNRGLVAIPPDIERTVGTEQVHYLDLSNNSLTQLKDELSFLKASLTSINLSGNKFGSFKQFLLQLFQFPGLNRLLVANNAIAEMPSHIGKFGYLQVLDVSSNSLRTLPPEINELTELTHLNLSQNKLVTLPSLTRLLQLVHMDLSHNELVYLPDDFLHGNEVLVMLNVSHNSLLSLDNIAFSASLVHIDLSFNTLSELPTKVFDVPNLATLNARNNVIFSLQAYRLKRLRKLEHLDLSHNPVSIPIRAKADDHRAITRYFHAEERAALKRKAAERKLTRRHSVPWLMDYFKRQADLHAPTIVDGKIVVRHVAKKPSVSPPAHTPSPTGSPLARGRPSSRGGAVPTDQPGLRTPEKRRPSASTLMPISPTGITFEGGSSSPNGSGSGPNTARAALRDSRRNSATNKTPPPLIGGEVSEVKSQSPSSVSEGGGEVKEKEKEVRERKEKEKVEEKGASGKESESKQREEKGKEKEKEKEGREKQGDTGAAGVGGSTGTRSRAGSESGISASASMVGRGSMSPLRIPEEREGDLDSLSGRPTSGGIIPPEPMSPSSDVSTSPTISRTTSAESMMQLSPHTERQGSLPRAPPLLTRQPSTKNATGGAKKHLADLFKLSKTKDGAAAEEAGQQATTARNVRERSRQSKQQSMAISDEAFVKRRVVALLAKDPKLELAERLEERRKEQERTRRKST